MAHETPEHETPARSGDGAANGARGRSAAHEAEMQELRRLLLGREADELAALQDRLDHIVEVREQGQLEAMSKVLPQAISMHNVDNTRLVNALEPSIEKTLQLSVRRNPQPFVDAIFPVIGPAIRRSIREALKSMMDAINRTLEHSLSLQSLKWRIEAARTGTSFSEVVLAHTLEYRVEQLFLIDRTSGLPIQHLYAESVEVKDSDIVSSMVRAIQDFVRDSLGAGKDDVMGRLEMGELTVIVEPGPRAILAAVVRGIPTPELHETLKQIIEAVHLQHAHLLESFNGDQEPFAVLRPLLRTGLLAQYRQKERSNRGAWIVLGLLGAAFLIWTILSVLNYVRWSDYIAALKNEPGIIVTETGWRNGRWIVEGLRDPLATPPDSLVPASLPAGRIEGRWEPYLALDPAIVVRRAARLLQAPASISFSMHGDTLVASGTAGAAWIRSARERAASIPGIVAYDDAGVAPVDDERVRQAMEQVEQTRLTFAPGSAVPAAGQAALLGAIAAALADIERHGRTYRLDIVGHASADGDAATNRLLSRRRAEAVRDVLVARGVPAARLTAQGAGEPSGSAEASESDREHNRSVTFRVELR